MLRHCEFLHRAKALFFLKETVLASRRRSSGGVATPLKRDCCGMHADEMTV
jgi:hypothetical protein